MQEPKNTTTLPSAPRGRQSNLGDVAYERLATWLTSGRFHAGMKLTVRAVADALGVSTTPARDAIHRLISEGALENLGPKTVVPPVLTLATLDEISKVRLALEGLAAFEGCANMIETDIDQIESIQVALEDAFDRDAYSEALACNREFHFLVYRRSGMPRLVGLIASQWLRIGPSLNDVYPLYDGAHDRFLNHRWIIEGLKNKDADAVRVGFESDIRAGRKRLADLISG